MEKMDRLIKWINDSEKYEFCRSYGVNDASEMIFVEHQEDFYISLLSLLHDGLERFYNAKRYDEKLLGGLLNLAKGLLVYSQKETEDAFYGVRRVNNQLYVAAIYYLCDYPAISSWIMTGIDADDYSEDSAQQLAYIVSGGKVVSKDHTTENLNYFQVKEFMVSGDTGFLDDVIRQCEEKYSKWDFTSPTDFYMTSMLRCVLKKFWHCNIWLSLRKIDNDFDWNDYAKHSYLQHVFSFLPSQQDAIDKGLMDFTGSFSLKMPTSAGKSYITELLIYYELRKNQNARILYLAPLRALSRELRDRFRKIHKRLGFTYATKYGGSAASVHEDNLTEAQLLIATPESFMTIESSRQELLDQFTLVICDEGQLLDDYSRGINYEMLLSRLRKRDQVRFLFISAIIPNINVVNQWLNGTDDHIGDSTYRPSKLVLAEALVNDDGVDLNIFNDVAGEAGFKIPDFITKNDTQVEMLRYYDEYAKKWKLSYIPIGCTLALKSLNAGSVLLFATGKTTGVSCLGLAKHIISMLGKEAIDNPLNYVVKTDELDEIIEYAAFQIGGEHLFCAALKNGFAIHHGDIPQDLREKAERAYDKGVIRLIISNTTLAEGVNLPIKTIVIANAMDPATPGWFLSNSRLKNIIGRVGRAGRERYGTVIVPTAYENGMLIQLIKQAMNPDDSLLTKMRGTLYDLTAFLVSKKIIKKEDDINELLSANAFSDAIDEMIVRSSEGNIEDMDLESLSSNSLAYTLSDEHKQDALRKVFSARYHVLRENVDGDKARLLRTTGLNLRDLEALSKNISADSVEMVANVGQADDAEFVEFIIGCVMSLPTVLEALKLESKKKQAFYGDTGRLVRVGLLWLQGYQYHEIAGHENISVDDAILLVNYLQGTVHNKAVCVLAYLRDVFGLESTTALFWPEYLRVGINTRLMLELHKLRVPERIQLHALQKFYESGGVSYDDFEGLQSSLIATKGKICIFMKEQSYPRLSAKGLMDVIDYMEKGE